MSTLFPSLTYSPEDKTSGLYQPINKPLFHVEADNIDWIIFKIKNLDNLSNEEIRDLILYNHAMILKYDIFFMNQESRSLAQKLFTDKRFLNIFIGLATNMNLTYHEIVCLNKLAYDYYQLNNNDQEIADLLFQLSSIINNGRKIICLSGILGMNSARILAMIRYSSFKEDKVVKRVNLFLMNYQGELSIQDIVNIYCYLFERVSNLIIYTMLECKPDNLSEESNKRFDQISIAILEILNSMTTTDISTIMKDYEYKLKSENIQRVRFSIKTAMGYPRIINAIKTYGISVI